MGLSYAFRDLVHYCQGGKYSRTQADMMLKKVKRVLDHQTAGSESHLTFLEHLKPQSPPLFFEQDYISLWNLLLLTKPSNIWVCDSLSYSNHHNRVPAGLFLLIPAYLLLVAFMSSHTTKLQISSSCWHALKESIRLDNTMSEPIA